MLAAIRENPIVVREWRILRRRAFDWRIWVGMKWSMDPVIWGAPVVLTYALAPYGLWAVLALLRRLRLAPTGVLPIDPLLMLVTAFAFYVVAMSLVLGATAITREREQQTWEQLCLTAMSRRERAAGFFWGRLGPLWASLAVTAIFWWVFQPHYARGLAVYSPTPIGRAQIALGALFTLAICVIEGIIGLLASALSKQTVSGIVSGVIGSFYAVVSLGSISPMFLLFFGAAFGQTGTFGIVTEAIFWIVLAVTVGLVCWGLWLSLEGALTFRDASAQNLKTYERLRKR